MSRDPRIAIVGLGNVGQHLFKALQSASARIEHVVSGREEIFHSLDTGGCKLHRDKSDLAHEALDLIFVCTPDNAIREIFKALAHHDAALVHCSGGTPTLTRVDGSSGVFYPFQTFSAEREIAWSEVPIFVSSSDPELSATLSSLGAQLSDHVQEISDEQRAWLHLAGVYGANFVNHMLRLMEQALEQAALPVDVAHALIKETTAKVLSQGATKSQTGPALRGDTESIRRHLELLNAFDDSAQKQQLYQLLSKSINPELP